MFQREEKDKGKNGLAQIVLQFDTVGISLELTHRYLWGPGIDFQFADEQLPVTNGNGDVRVCRWALERVPARGASKGTNFGERWEALGFGIS